MKREVVPTIDVGIIVVSHNVSFATLWLGDHSPRQKIVIFKKQFFEITNHKLQETINGYFIGQLSLGCL